MSQKGDALADLGVAWLFVPGDIIHVKNVRGVLTKELATTLVRRWT